MDVKTAYTIIGEMQKWRRGNPPYDGDTPETHRQMPYTAKEYGEALDVALGLMESYLQTEKLRNQNDTISGRL